MIRSRQTLILCSLMGLLFSTAISLAEVAPVKERIANREFPSIFQAWNKATPLPGADDATMQAMHDLVFLHPSHVGLKSETKFEGIAFDFTPESLAKAKAWRADLLSRNPNIVLLAEVRYRDAPKGFIPEEAPWWQRNAKNEFVPGWAEGGYRLLDVAQADWQTQVAKRAKAVMDTGVFDGVMLDWWKDDEPRLNLVRRVREAIGNDALVIVNSNHRQIPRTAEYVNGLFMECYRTKSPADWKDISETLRWAEKTLRAPRINCLETWYHQSRGDLPLMRAVTTLSLTQSDGYSLFADPNPLPAPDHLHDWYPFWDKGLGRPTKSGTLRGDGAWEREFSKGTVIYNPSGGANVTVNFDSPHQSRASGLTGTTHTVNPFDGDIFIRK